ILLAALDNTIGSCWLGSVDRKKIKKLLRIPHHMKVDSVIALGYPKETPTLEDATDSIKYWKDDNGILHVPKRSFKSVCHKNVYGNHSDLPDT
ncbi:hypothetical protein BVY01_02135, partial [bacterium I07]